MNVFSAPLIKKKYPPWSNSQSPLSTPFIQHSYDFTITGILPINMFLLYSNITFFSTYLLSFLILYLSLRTSFWVYTWKWTWVFDKKFRDSLPLDSLAHINKFRFKRVNILVNIMMPITDDAPEPPFPRDLFSSSFLSRLFLFHWKSKSKIQFRI